MNKTLKRNFTFLFVRQGSFAKVGMMMMLATACVAWPWAARSQEPTTTPVPTPSTPIAHPLPPITIVATKAELEAWRRKIVVAPRAKANACYQASYPEVAWHEVTCKSIQQKANLPRIAKGARVAQVGGAPGSDFVATTINNITEAEGTFDSVTTSGANNLSSYMLQTNTAPFTTTTCNGSTPTGSTAQPSCQGWQQFIYSTDNGGEVFIQYWLLGWGPANAKCKAPVSTQCNGSDAFTDGWCPYTATDADGISFTDCVINGVTNLGSAGSGIGDVAAANLTDIVMTSFPADASNASDNAIATISGTANHVSGANIFPDLKTNWTQAEFNIFGDGGGSEAFFNPNTTVEVRTSVTSDTPLSPACFATSFTGESNNLTLVGTTSNPAAGSLPSLVFTETNVGNPTTNAGCGSAISLGDTHIHPFNGQTEYDFQAYGDFVLAQAGPDFMVETRQVPGPPQFPGTATNLAVAVLMGKTRIAVTLQPVRLFINSVETDLAIGKTLILAGGVQVMLKGGQYYISDSNGNSVIADPVNTGKPPLWMQVTVNLGRSPDSRVRGLLGNPSDPADEIMTAGGVALKVPVDVADLYGQFADSWRVNPSTSLFTELPPPVIGAPTKPLTAGDLTIPEKAHALTACKAAGVTNAALLDDCVLDTTVLKEDAAVTIFTRIAPPKFVIKPVLHIVPK